MGSLTIPESSLIYIDTSIVIYKIEQVANYCTLLNPLWDKFQAGEISLLSSELILLESLVLPIRRGNTQLLNAYQQLLLTSSIRLIPISQSILREAAQLRATTGLKTPDAIHAATALGDPLRVSRRDCSTLFLTNDRQFRVVSGLPVIVLNEVLAS